MIAKDRQLWCWTNRENGLAGVTLWHLEPSEMQKIFEAKQKSTLEQLQELTENLFPKLVIRDYCKKNL